MSDAGTKPDADKPAAAADPPAAANGSVEPPLINISKGIYIYIYKRFLLIKNKLQD